MLARPRWLRRLSFAFVFFLLLPVLASSLVSCGNRNDLCTLRLWIAQKPETLNPLTASDQDAALILRCLTTRLTEYDAVTVTDCTTELNNAVRKERGISENEGHSFRIRLNPALCWADGTPVTAEDFVFTVRTTLSPELRCEAATAITGSLAAPLNSRKFFDSGEPQLKPIVTPYADAAEADYSFDPESAPTYFCLWRPTVFSPLSLREWYEKGIVAGETYQALAEIADRYGIVPYTEQTRAAVTDAVRQTAAGLGLTYSEEYLKESLFTETGQAPVTDFSKVGISEEADGSVLWFTEKQASADELLALLGDMLLIRKSTYEAEETYSMTLTAASYGPYKVTGATETGMTLEKNPRWIGLNEADHDADAIRFTAGSYTNAITQFMCGELDFLPLRETDASQYESTGLVHTWEEGSALVSPRIEIDPDDPVGSCRFLQSDEAWKNRLLSHGGRIS